MDIINFDTKSLHNIDPHTKICITQQQINSKHVITNTELNIHETSH